MESYESIKMVSLIAKFGVCFVGFSLVYFTFRLWINGKRLTEKNLINCENKVTLITGASNGIGKMTALALAKRGCHIIMACRDMDAGIKAQNEIIHKSGNKNVECMHLDLGSFKSIRSFADKFLSTHSRLDTLINNASVMRMPYGVTEDGLEQNIGINHFGHFLLTMLLLRRMSESWPSRIINVSNWVHRCVELDKTNLMCETQYNGILAYARSKLANIYFTIGLDSRIEDSGIICNAVHPGIVFTDYIKRLGSSSTFSFPRWIYVWLSKILCKSEEACADTIVFAAADFNVQNIGGIYISNTQSGEMGTNSHDQEAIDWLWRKSEEICGIKFEDCIDLNIQRKISN